MPENSQHIKQKSEELINNYVKKLKQNMTGREFLAVLKEKSLLEEFKNLAKIENQQKVDL